MSTEQTESTAPKFSSNLPESEMVQQGFLARNFLWISPLLLIGVAVGALFLGGYFQLDLMKEPADNCLIVLNYVPTVAEKIGTPVTRDSDVRVTGSFVMRESKEYAKMDRFNVKGPKGTAVAYGTMVRTNNKQGWKLWRLAVDFEDGDTIYFPEDGPAGNATYPD